MSASTSSTAERRRHPRVAARLKVVCERLGREGLNVVAEVVDLSMAGVRISAPPELQVGDVVRLTVEAPERLLLSGLVVHVTVGPAGARYGHIAFTHVVPPLAEQIGQLIDLTVKASRDLRT